MKKNVKIAIAVGIAILAAVVASTFITDDEGTGRLNVGGRFNTSPQMMAPINFGGSGGTPPHGDPRCAITDRGCRKKCTENQYYYKRDSNPGCARSPMCRTQVANGCSTYCEDRYTGSAERSQNNCTSSGGQNTGNNNSFSF